MLDQLRSLAITLECLLDYAYPPVDVTPVLLSSQPDYRAHQKASLSGMSLDERVGYMRTLDNPNHFLQHNL